MLLSLILLVVDAVVGVVAVVIVVVVVVTPWSPGLAQNPLGPHCGSPDLSLEPILAALVHPGGTFGTLPFYPSAPEGTVWKHLYLNSPPLE